MHDVDVRHAVRKRLNRLHKGEADTLIVEEMGIWANFVRIDVAVINGEFHGFELKSERDTLARLPRQASVYNEVFDRVTLVMAEKHCRKAADKIPDWWGILSARTTKRGHVALKTERRPRLNPCISLIHVARLFWKSEAIAVLEKHGLSRGFKSKTSEEIAQRLASSLPLDTLRDEARAAMKARASLLREPFADVRDVPV
jgi:hypothetical protein